MNNKEIELKFGYDGKADNLFETFSKIGNVSAESEQHLDNTYFDTDDKDLFALKAGLRIRRADTFTEQTLKVKGENIGGLHKRVEYNLPIDDTAEVPNLLKFPKEAFPESTIVIGIIAKVLVSFTVTALSKVSCPKEQILSQVEATAVTDDVSFTAVPAKIPKAMLLCDIPRF